MLIFKLLPFPIFVVLIVVQLFTTFQNRHFNANTIEGKRSLCKILSLLVPLVICLVSCLIVYNQNIEWITKVFFAAWAYLMYAIGYFVEHEIIKYPNDNNRWRETIRQNSHLLLYFLPFYFFILATSVSIDFTSFQGWIDFFKNCLVYLFKYWYLTATSIGLILTISYKARARRYL
jgi:putative effector of murein hydrolase LrgA (UPF0299 family)